MATQFLKEIENIDDKEPSEIRPLVIKWIEKLFPAVQSVGTETLQQWMEEKPEELLILDIRTAAEFEVSHLPGAILVSAEGHALQELLKAQFMQEHNRGHRRIICYCTVGYRSSIAAQVANGILPQVATTSLDVYNIQGGLVKWATERRRMVSHQGSPTQLVHPYSPIWAKLLEPEFRAEI
ncbi:tRNA uridine(34) hydroxylase-like [Eublepharis macularius]|uniref:tRNA uridine(34) hydroxylase-like n=1 Tax=Eublepharis macularius TaxID=481883 RepID=A0AA97KJ75_EUBMA|nr:tRNA uridine(34) hydroxylase-like [Eublepharis macularius]